MGRGIATEIIATTYVLLNFIKETRTKVLCVNNLHDFYATHFTPIGEEI